MAKRAFDILFSGFLSLIFAVPALVIALLIRLTSKGPVIYWSSRMGKDDEPFMMPKFRTMQVDTPLVPTAGLKDPDRYVTWVGRILWKTSLDELPQIYSVLVGEMSLVGPRPVIIDETELLRDRRLAGVNKLKPGITGWAQINGRDGVTPAEKVRLDAEYLARKSIWFDVVILWRTFFYVIGSRGIWH